MDTDDLLMLMMTRTLPLLWRAYRPLGLIELSQKNDPYQLMADFVFSPTGHVRYHSNLEPVADDDIDLSMILWERGDPGQKSVEFQLGCKETD